ncbi:MAG: hypothetical protein ACLUFV_12485 [Acutalibacteraceae bacterium]
MITNRLQRLLRRAAEDAAAALARSSARPCRRTCRRMAAGHVARLPAYDALVEALIDRGLLVPPADGVGAEGCWLTVEPMPAQQTC